MTFNLSVIVRESARVKPDTPALIHGERTVTYRELDELSDRVAGNLIARGIEPGDVVGVQLGSVPEFPIALYGILKAGAIALPMNILNKAREIEFYLTDSRARAMITNLALGDDGLRGAEVADVRNVFIVNGGYPPPVQFPHARPFTDLLVPQPDFPRPYVQREPNDPAIILYTSGTTGRPKGVELTHVQLYFNARAHVDSFSMDENTVVLGIMPLFHSLGLSGILNATLSVAGTVVLYQRFDPADTLEGIEKHGATLLHAVPTIYHSLLEHPDLQRRDISTLEMCGSAGAPIAADLMDRLEEALGASIVEMYGLTESGPLATANTPDDRRQYSIGKPIWGTEVQIWDEDHNELPRGKEHVGELVLRGHNTMRGYFNDEQATQEAFAGGWLHTGDLGYCDEDGFLFIVDRKKEMIIRGGYNVYPREVEEVMYRHPEVDEVAVIGVPSEHLGEEIKAFVTLKQGATVTTDDLIQYTKERVAAYKYPRAVEVLDVMPKTASNKILKQELKTR